MTRKIWRELWGGRRGRRHKHLLSLRQQALEITIDVTTLGVLLILFFATLIRSAFGFGEALVAVPLLAFFIPLTVAAPLAVLVSITIATIVVIQDWKKIHMRSTAWLVVSTLAGIPLGVLLLTSSHQRMVKAALGVVIILFSAYSLTGRAPLELKREIASGFLFVDSLQACSAEPMA